MPDGTPARSSKREQGAALIAMVLMMVMLLALLVVISANIGLASRRSTAEQKTVLPAQYAAESGVTSARTLVVAVRDIAAGISIPRGEPSSAVQTWVGQLCPVPVPATAFPLQNKNALSFPVSQVYAPAGSNENRMVGTQVCLIPSLSTDAQTALFVDSGYVPQAVYDKYGVGSAQRASFIKTVFAGSAAPSRAVGSATVNFSLQPVALTRPGPDEYRFYFVVGDVDSVGSAANATRRIRMTSDRKLYYIRIYRDNFARYAYFANHWYDEDTSDSTGQKDLSSYGYFDDSVFIRGPVHVNQSLGFLGAANFYGELTSSGCPQSQITTVNYANGDRADKCNAALQGGAYFDNGSKNFVASSQLTSVNVNNNGFYNPTAPNGMKINVNVDASGNTPPNFDRSFVEFPRNGNDQVAAAKAGGLYVNSDVNLMALSVSVDTGIKYQVMQVTNASGVTSKYRFASDNRMQMYDSVLKLWRAAKTDNNGNWYLPGIPVLQGDVYNGVFFANGQIKSITGPMRSPPAAATTTAGGLTTDANGVTSPAAAAVANFSTMTIASQKMMTVTGDLKYEQSPCTSLDATQDKCKTTDANGNFIKNILGLYAVDQDIQVANTPANNGQTQVTDPAQGVVNAPKNIEINAVMMSSGGGLSVQNFSATAKNGAWQRGNLNVVGGNIQNRARYTTYSNQGGYYENYVYDKRTNEGYAPPSFPTQKTWEPSLTSDASGAPPLGLYGELRQDSVGSP